ncbi:MAG: heavy metal translocating P-type ATPase [Bacilli bacterium]|nr:heavy metal translocating P-type ATPase [Bacilli bacterium]
MKHVFDIKGMTCSACSARIDKVIGEQKGVQNVNVNLLKNEMVVEYDETIISTDKMIDVVKQTGYQASIKQNRTINQDNPLKTRLIMSIIFLIPLLYLSMSGMLKLPIPKIFVENFLVFLLEQLLFVIAIVIVNIHYFIVGFQNLWKRSPNMDTLIAVSSSAAIIYGLYIMVSYIIDRSSINSQMHHLYFESAGMILTLITLGKYFEGNAKRRTTDSLKKLIDMSPKTATIIKDGQEVVVASEEVVVNDLVIVRKGEGIPVDGIIIEGVGIIDEATLTGESNFVDKVVNDTVYKATINHSGYFIMKATQVGEDTAYDKIIKLVDEASSSKAPISRLADKISGIFVPIVMVISLFSLVIWLLLGKSFSFALLIAISVLVISCPCALGLATPTAIMVATGMAAKHHILIKSAASLEKLQAIDTVLLDKTGTITEGKPVLTDVIHFNYDLKKLNNIIYSLEKRSEHPLAKGMIEHLETSETYPVTDYQAIFGQGIEGIIDHQKVMIGNLRMMDENKITYLPQEALINQLLAQGKIVLLVAIEETLIGIVALRDKIKPTSKEAIKEMQKLNINVAMISGDSLENSRIIANEVGITNIYAEVLPSEKDLIVQKLQNEAHQVAFIGDGVNDTIALTRADVAIAIGSGTDVAIDSADIVLVKNELLDALNAIKLSKMTMRIIKENLFWAFIYNIILIPLAAGVLYPAFQILLQPMYAAMAMSISSIFVVTNALRIRRFKAKISNGGESTMVKKVKIDGMMCEHCKARVEKAILEIPHVKVSVDLTTKIATITSTIDIDEKDLRRRIKNAGYTVVSIE